MTEKSEDTVALFIDAENIIRPLENELERLNLDIIIRRAREEGFLILSRAYADWGFTPCRDYIREFTFSGVEMAQLHSDKKGKNTADMQLTIDSIEHCLSEYGAKTFFLVSGDRDFVPLVQFLRRHGRRVVCVCVEDTASTALRGISDVYIAYHTLKAPQVTPTAHHIVEAEPVSPKKETVEEVVEETEEVSEKIQALQTLVDAVNAINRRGQQPIGGFVNTMMRQLLPSFDLGSLGFNSFKEFAEAARLEGLIDVTVPSSGIGDILIEVKEAKPAAVPKLTKPKYSYATTEDALTSYRLALENKRVPLIRWEFREPLVKYLWKRLEERGESGIFGWDLVDLLEDFANDNDWRLREDEIVKLIYTLNLGFCFKINGVAGKSSDILNNTVSTAVEDDKAIEMMHLVYLRGITFEDYNAVFLPEAVSELLFNSQSEEHIEIAQKLIYGIYAWH